MNWKNLVSWVGVAIALNACTYMKYTAVQSEYERIHQASPAQQNLKHLIDQQTFYVVGQTLVGNCQCRHQAMAVAAYSDQYQTNERVDTMYFATADSHFGLNLPSGRYQLRVFADGNNDGQFSAEETVGEQSLQLDDTTAPNHVLSGVKIKLTQPQTRAEIKAFAVKQSPPAEQSLFYPGGTIRTLDDPLFDPGMATLGMYDPAAFLEKAPTMFYALEEDAGYKVPVIFVHGIGGSAREFEPLVARLDRNRYKPWFFYYPSGGDLQQLAELFYRIFLSGKVIPTQAMPLVIVSHSMGGLIVREALNHYQGPDKDNNLTLWFSLASPFAGHPAAASGVKHGLIVLPAWRDLAPDSEFISALYRTALATNVEYQLLYAFGNPKAVKTGDNSDGVVPLASQLRPQAQAEATHQLGIDASHQGILQSEQAMAYVLERIAQVHSIFPDSHLVVIDQGGYDIPLEHYSPMTQYIVHNLGYYLTAVVLGQLTPINAEQQHFVDAVNGRVAAKTKIERECLKFKQEYPQYF